MKSTTHICTECQVPREEGGGCYTFCEGKRFIPIPTEEKPMKQRKSIKVSKEKAIIIASNHNNIPIEKAKEYTDSELREVLRHLNLKPGF